MLLLPGMVKDLQSEMGGTKENGSQLLQKKERIRLTRCGNKGF